MKDRDDSRDEDRSPLERGVERDRREIRAELADHVARRAKALEADGMSAAEARAEARRRLGDHVQLEDELLRMAERRGRRRVWLGRLDALRADVRHALRGMRRRPVLNAGIVLTMGLAMGAAAAVFAIVNGVLLRPLGYPSSSNLYSVYTRYLPATGYDFPVFTLSGPELVDYRSMTRAMSGVAAYDFGMANLSIDDGTSERVTVSAATANLFDVLDVSPVLGRGFEPGEDGPGRPCVVVLSDGLWRERFGGDGNVIGRSVRLDGESCEVIGVMARGFWFPVERVRLWTTQELDETSPLWHRESHPFVGVARLRPDMTPAGAQAEIDGLRGQWSAEYPDHYAKGHFLILVPLLEDIVGDTRSALLTLLAAVGVVLLIVCVNLAGLMLAAAESRRKEFAVRLALGVGRGRLTQQNLTESLMLALTGGVIGLVSAFWLVRGIVALYPGGLPRGTEINVDLAVAGFTAVAALGLGLFMGLLPAVQSARVNINEILRTAGRGLTLHRKGVDARRVFVVAQTALALLLVVGATLLAQSYARLRAVDLGFDSEDALTFSVTVPSATYPDATRARDYFLQLEDRLAAIPGVVAAGAVSNLPLRSAGGADDFIIEGKALPAPGEMQWNARYQMATPSALGALGLDMVRGRWFEPMDRRGAPPVAVINETTARLYYPDTDPIGKRIRYYGSDAPWITIIGVVSDVRSFGAAEAAPPAIFTALEQAPRPPYAGRSMNLVVRFAAAAPAGAAAVRAAVAEMDSSLPPSELATLESVVTESVGRPRFTVTLMTAFALVALLLGALGLYGVLAHAVQRRLQEIAIRLTLGARRMQVLSLIVTQGVLPVAMGIGIGLVAAVVLRNTIASLLFGVSALDPVTLLLAAVILMLVSLVACGLPALRASRIDPNIALRAE